ncbi:MAG: GGDEF domain-containing protein [Pseudomonadales bacterium]|nr:GGDEF domain-containing protein [Pseudomonadales bacterium]
MEQETSQFLEAVLGGDSESEQPLSVESIKAKCGDGVAYWSDLELEDAFSAIGLNERQIERIQSTSQFDKTAIIQKLLDELSRTTLEDGLTKVYNRRYFERTMESELDRSRRDQRPCGLVLLDIDHFKNFNDTYGHDVGDLVLKSVATTIKNLLRSTDTVSRVGGEEFAIIVPNTFRLDAGFLAERIRKHVEEHKVKVDDKALSVTISMGIAMNDPKLITTVDELYKQADKALYEAKQSGRNCVKFSVSETETSSSAVTADERNELLG